MDHLGAAIGPLWPAVALAGAQPAHTFAVASAFGLLGAPAALPSPEGSSCQRSGARPGPRPAAGRHDRAAGCEKGFAFYMASASSSRSATPRTRSCSCARASSAGGRRPCRCSGSFTTWSSPPVAIPGRRAVRPPLACRRRAAGWFAYALTYVGFGFANAGGRSWRSSSPTRSTTVWPRAPSAPSSPTSSQTRRARPRLRPLSRPGRRRRAPRRLRHRLDLGPLGRPLGARPQRGLRGGGGVAAVLVGVCGHVAAREAGALKPTISVDRFVDESLQMRPPSV